MKTRFKDKRIIVSAIAHEEVRFDIGTSKYCTQFDGRGGINYFHYVDNPRYNAKGRSFLNIFIDDVPMPIFGKKRVVNCGRTQKITYFLDGGQITISQFGKDSFIFYRVTSHLKNEHKIVFVFDYTGFKDVPALAASIAAPYCAENYSYFIECGGNAKFNVAVSFTDDPKKMVRKAASIERELNDEIDGIKLPSLADNEMKKAMYASCMFTALENYKSLPGYEALMAGVNYLSPCRTYFRDSYWTMLPLYQDHLDIVRTEILTLARGVKDDGECPSAVKSNYESFWGGHYDSPCFFLMEIYDYIHNGGDASILDEVINGKFTLKDLAVRVINRVMSLCDHTHLLFKKGPLNRLDWADAVNRNGYVTYDECLYYRALLCAEKITGDASYGKEAEFVKKAINEILWDESKGYYVNYIDGDFIEENLSVDTCLAPLFGIVPEERKERLFDNFEKILFSKNHDELEDFGVLSVYPNYRRHETVLSISAQPFRYHNGGNWPYWSGVLALVFRLENRPFEYPLVSWFEYNIKRCNFTPLEYFSPYYEAGSNLQAWSSTPAFAMQDLAKTFFSM